MNPDKKENLLQSSDGSERLVCQTAALGEAPDETFRLWRRRESPGETFQDRRQRPVRKGGGLGAGLGAGLREKIPATAPPPTCYSFRFRLVYLFLSLSG